MTTYIEELKSHCDIVEVARSLGCLPDRRKAKLKAYHLEISIFEFVRREAELKSQARTLQKEKTLNFQSK